MLLEDHVVVVVVEEHGDGAELGGGAAGRGDLVRLQEVDLPEQNQTPLIHLSMTVSRKDHFGEVFPKSRHDLSDRRVGTV